MSRRIAVTLAAILLWTAVAARAQDWRAGVDSRVELMSVLFRLAGNSEYHQCRIPVYDKAIENYFRPYREHLAVQLARSLGTGFDGPMKLAVNVRDVDSLDEVAPLDRPALHLYEGWDAGKAREFLTAARQFTADAKFQDFLKSQQPLYDATNARLQAFVRDKADLGWFARFFGAPAPARFVIVPGMANGGPSYAARVTDTAGMQEVYGIPGVSKVDADGIPEFDSNWRTTMVHELAHTYANPAAGKFAARLQKPAQQIYAAVAEAMRGQSYGNWRVLLNESLARAATVEYVMEHDGPEAARALIRKENSRSFFWISGLVELMEASRSDPQHYPTFESMMPRVAEFFDDLAPRIHDLIDRIEPKVVSTSIGEGARDVDPTVTAIVVRFSMAMNRVGPEKNPKLNGGRFDTGGTTVTIPVALEPDREYAIPLRWAGGQAFVSSEGVPLPAAVLHFRTGAAPAKPK